MEERNSRVSGEEREKALAAWTRLLQLHRYTDEEISLLADKFTDAWLKDDSFNATLENIRIVADDFFASQTPRNSEGQ